MTIEDPKLDSNPSELRHLSETLQRMVESLEGGPSAGSSAEHSARRMQKSERMKLGDFDSWVAKKRSHPQGIPRSLKIQFSFLRSFLEGNKV